MIRSAFLALLLALGAAPATAQPAAVITDRANAFAVVNAEVAKMATFAEARRKVERDVFFLSEEGKRVCLNGHHQASTVADNAALSRLRQGVTLPLDQLPLKPQELQGRFTPALWAQLVAQGHLAAYFAAVGKLSETDNLLAGHETALNTRRTTGRC
jgi:hypothetical protein